MDAYVKLAVNTINEYIKDRRIYRPAPGELPEEMLTKRAGAFVSIHKGDALRGCIGTLGPVRDNIAEEIISNAISAAVRDPRFPAITEEELEDLTINVDVLTEPEYIRSKDELDVKRYGVIVRKGRRTGVLLPDLEGVDTIDYQVNVAKMKAGIRTDDEDVELYRFEVVRHV